MRHPLIRNPAEMIRNVQDTSRTIMKSSKNLKELIRQVPKNRKNESEMPSGWSEIEENPKNESEIQRNMRKQVAKHGPKGQLSAQGGRKEGRKRRGEQIERKSDKAGKDRERERERSRASMSKLLLLLEQKRRHWHAKCFNIALSLAKHRCPGVLGVPGVLDRLSQSHTLTLLHTCTSTLSFARKSTISTFSNIACLRKHTPSVRQSVVRPITRSILDQFKSAWSQSTSGCLLHISSSKHFPPTPCLHAEKPWFYTTDHFSQCKPTIFHFIITSPILYRLVFIVKKSGFLRRTMYFIVTNKRMTLFLLLSQFLSTYPTYIVVYHRDIHVQMLNIALLLAKCQCPACPWCPWCPISRYFPRSLSLFRSRTRYTRDTRDTRECERIDEKSRRIWRNEWEIQQILEGIDETSSRNGRNASEMRRTRRNERAEILKEEVETEDDGGSEAARRAVRAGVYVYTEAE